jgi:hypothetical protein
MNSFKLRVLLTTAAVTTGCIVAAPSAVAAPAPTCRGHRATIVGTPGDDVLDGTEGRDVIVGLGGSDTITGGAGNDLICAGGGADSVDAGDGNDKVYGSGGNDTIGGGAGRDTIDGQGGRDHLDSGSGSGGLVFGGSGNDRLVLNETKSFAFGEAGNDKITSFASGASLDGGDDNDTLHGDAGSAGDEVHGDAGNDYLFGEADRSHLYGGSGDDQLEGSAKHLLLEGDTGNDTITGSDNADTIDAGAGADKVQAGGGNDVLVFAGPGSDTVYGGTGDDVIDMGDGADFCYGEQGSDQCQGGTPGTLANTVDDPDVCDAESMTSCKSTELPSKWVAHLVGTSTYDNGFGTVETTQWDMSTTIHLSNEHNDLLTYTDDPRTRGGTYSVHGTLATAGGSCSVAAAGSLTESDVSVTARIDRSAQTYGLDWIGLGSVEDSAVCAGEEQPHVTHVGAEELFDGVTFTPDSSGVVGAHRTYTNGDSVTEDYTYTLTPIAQPANVSSAEAGLTRLRARSSCYIRVSARLRTRSRSAG